MTTAHRVTLARVIVKAIDPCHLPKVNGMPYAKTSLRARQRALCKELRERGMSNEQIVHELVRQYKLRPRAAWRVAHGWSLTEAAEQINVYAAGSGLGSSNTVAMTAAHLSEHENWPGVASVPTGRRPTPYLLSLLAAVYGCAIDDLLDAADRERMPASDRLVLDKIAPGDGRRADVTEQSASGPAEAVSPAGVVSSEQAGSLGLSWESTPDNVTAMALGLLKAGTRNPDLAASAWSVAAIAEPLGRWLLDSADREVAGTGSRRVGRADVDAVWAMCSAFAEADHRLGGDHARRTLVFYADDVAAPLLTGKYTERVGRDLFTAVARLVNIAGFMCFDADYQRLGQEYFIAALRMAKVSGDEALGAHILTDMSIQAQHQRNAQVAVALADASVTTARRSGSVSTLARCHAVRARALALQGDVSESDHALNEAERALDRVGPRDEPPWMTFFTHQQLAAESMYAAAELRRTRLVQRRAADVLTADGDAMQRRQVLATATLAASYLPADGAGEDAEADVEQACVILHGVLPVIASQTSARALSLVGAVRGRLAGYPQITAVQDLEREFGECLAGVGS